MFEDEPGPLLVPLSVVTEVCYLLASRIGTAAEVRFLESIRDGELEIVDVTSSDLTRAVELIEQYSDLPLGFTDATVLAIAERLRIARIATIDRRHFTVLRPSHVDALELVPAVP